MQFENKTALVTGAGNGIGRATALALAREGANLVIVDMKADDVRKVKKEIEGMGRTCLDFEADVTDNSRTGSIFSAIKDTFGRLDILVNNVGGLKSLVPVVDMPRDDWEFCLRTNLSYMFDYSQHAGKMMLNQKSGVVINVSSILGLGGISRRVGYATAKSAVNSLTQTLASEWALDGIRVNCVAPGYILTEPLQQMFDKGTLNPENMLRRTPQGRFGSPDDIAQAISFLCSDQAAFITGVVLYVDGGYSAYHGPEPVPSRW